MSAATTPLPAVTLRDTFAAASLIGLLPAFADDLQPCNAHVVADMAFIIADAMIFERDRDGGQ